LRTANKHRAKANPQIGGQHFFPLMDHPQMWQFEDHRKLGAPQKGFTKFVRLANLPQMRQFKDLQFADPKFLAICGPGIWQT
jgi:hypothetical protein